MCPPKVVDDIGPSLTDEELIICLESIQNRCPRTSLPRNVCADINPYLCEPSNLPENIWYLVHSEDSKQSEVGFWKTKDDPCQVYSGSSVIGWRTTLAFYEGHSPNGHRTDWLMQEYSTSHKGSSHVKASLLCRVFFSDSEGEKQKMDPCQANNDVRGQNNLFYDEGNKSGRPSMSKLQADMERYQAMPSNQGEELLQGDCLATGDYLELQDLDDPLLSSSSSENSSCMSQSSDVYFDSVALLQELECEDEVCQTKPLGHKFSTLRPNEMDVSLAAEGSPVSQNNKTVEPTEVESCSSRVLGIEKRLRDKDHVPENAKKRPPPVSNDAGASSSRQKPGADKGKKVVRGKTIKKFFCFIAF